jgi:hypothetical protein
VEHRFRADIAARAGTVLDHEGLAEPRAQPLRDDAGCGVDAAAGCDVDDDLDRLAGIIRLGLSHRGRRRQYADEQERERGPNRTAECARDGSRRQRHESSRGVFLNGCFTAR